MYKTYIVTITLACSTIWTPIATAGTGFIDDQINAMSPAQTSAIEHSLAYYRQNTSYELQVHLLEDADEKIITTLLQDFKHKDPTKKEALILVVSTHKGVVNKIYLRTVYENQRYINYEIFDFIIKDFYPLVAKEKFALALEYLQKTLFVYYGQGVDGDTTQSTHLHYYQAHPTDLSQGFRFEHVNVIDEDTREISTVDVEAVTLGHRSAFSTLFNDVYNGHPHAKNIVYLKENGIVEGYADGTFKPHDYVNRAELLAILLRSTFGDEEAKQCRISHPYPSFADTPITSWYTMYVCLAKQNAIISGYPDGTFKPGQPVSFAEASKIIALTYKLPLDQTNTGPWYEQYMLALEEYGALPASLRRKVDYLTRSDLAFIVSTIDSKINDRIMKSLEYPSSLRGSLGTYKEVVFTLE